MQISYSIVFTPKYRYRRKAIFNQYRKSIREILIQLCKYKGVEIIEGKLMVDHVHMLVSIPPKISVSSFMGYLKGKSALMIFDRHANLKYKYGNRHFWAEGYYVSTVGLNEATIAKYIREQDQHVFKSFFKCNPYRGYSLHLLFQIRGLQLVVLLIATLTRGLIRYTHFPSCNCFLFDAIVLHGRNAFDIGGIISNAKKI